MFVQSVVFRKIFLIAHIYRDIILEQKWKNFYEVHFFLKTLWLCFQSYSFIFFLNLWEGQLCFTIVVTHFISSFLDFFFALSSCFHSLIYLFIFTVCKSVCLREGSCLKVYGRFLHCLGGK